MLVFVMLTTIAVLGNVLFYEFQTYVYVQYVCYCGQWCRQTRTLGVLILHF